MKEDENLDTNIWDFATAFLVVLLVFLCAGTPDLLDALISKVHGCSP